MNINSTNTTTISSSSSDNIKNFFATEYFIIIVISIIVVILIIIIATVSYVLMTQKDDTISPQTKQYNQYSQSVPNSTPIPKNTNHTHGQTMSEFHIALSTFKNQQKKMNHVPANSTDIDIDNLSDIDEEDQVIEIQPKSPKSPKSPKYKTVNENNNNNMDENDSEEEESSLSINTDSDMREEQPNNKWNCPLCTYENNINKSKCSMCLTPQPISFDDEGDYDNDYINCNNNKQKAPPKFQPRIKPLPPPRKPTSPKRPYITKI